jgi:hypothetical protein
MPPRKTKKVEEVKDTPIVFFLRVNEKEDTIIPVGETITYSEILSNTFSENKAEERFNNAILKPLLENIHRDKEYSRNTCCFWCCHPFSGTKFVLPINYDTYKNVYNCEGHYCSPECSLAFLYDMSISESTRWYRHSLLINLYGFMYEDYLISPAPTKYLLRMFGGILDIKQFREYIQDSNEIILSEFPPIRMLFPSMNIQGHFKDVKKYVSLSNEIMDKASESLRIKRTKPLQVNVPTLEMCIKR